MKRNLTFRQRGYDMLQISLGVAIVLSLMVGALLMTRQIFKVTSLSEKTRVAASVSSEMFMQYNRAANFDNIASDMGTGGAAAGSTFALRSGMSDDMLQRLSITGSGQAFVLTFSGLNESVCERMMVSDLGPKSSPDNTNCGTGILAVTYTR